MLSKNINIEMPILLHCLTTDNYDASVATLKQLIESNPLTSLSYYQLMTPLTDIQCRFIADIISLSTKLNSFSLSVCSMPTMAFPIILQAITTHPGITELTFEDVTLINLHLRNGDADVGYTRIADDQAILIATMLKQNNRIKRLNLDDNEIENAGGMALADALEKHPNLWELKLSGRQFCDEIKTKIKELTHRNRQLIINGPTHQAQASFWRARAADPTAMPEIPSLKSLCQHVITVHRELKDDSVSDEKLSILPADIKPNI